MSSLASQRLGEHLDGIEKALAVGGGTHGVMDVLQQLSKGGAQLWTDEDALIITEVHDAPKLRELRFWIATGKLDAVIQLSKRVLDWGREMGCDQAVLTGRRGWVKPLAAEGWEPWMVVMGRKL